jgi:transposase-like protein
LVKISSAGTKAPPLFGDISVNFCKNPKCANFGVPETPFRARLTKGAAPQPGDYNLVAAGKGLPQLQCLLCREIMPIRSNQAIHEEVARVMGYLVPPTGPSCQTETCSMLDVPLSAAGATYVQRGKTAAGTQRYRCNACKKTFSGVGKSTKRHRMPHKNRDVFALLISQMALRRMAWFTELDRKTLYGKIDFIHRQCQAFSGEREQRLLTGMPLPKLYLATDRQTLMVNWSQRKDRRNVMLQAIATADLKSGYVFGMDLNFDPSLDLDEVEAQAAKLGDSAKAQPFRRFARLWLKADYNKAVEASAERKAAKKGRRRTTLDTLAAEIQALYDDADLREDVEEVVSLDKDEKLPNTGVEVRDQYTVYAHFLMIERLLGRAPKVRCYMDQDSGFRAAFMAAFHRQVKERRADGWFVKVMKEATIDQKDAAVAKAKKRMQEVQTANPTLDELGVRILMALDEMDRMSTVGRWDDRWLVHPVPSKAEPDKRLCWLTDIGLPRDANQDADDELRHAARLYLKGSLHAVDRFFMQVRRSVRLAERSIATASSDRRTWHGYAAYQPHNLAKVLSIYKTAYNYCLADSKGKTPAMKFGLAKAPIPLEHVLYFQPDGASAVQNPSAMEKAASPKGNAASNQSPIMD